MIEKNGHEKEMFNKARRKFKNRRRQLKNENSQGEEVIKSLNQCKIYETCNTETR